MDPFLFVAQAPLELVRTASGLCKCPVTAQAGRFADSSAFELHKSCFEIA